jgi:LPXTG-motif cell wall-anchored protein
MGNEKEVSMRQVTSVLIVALGIVIASAHGTSWAQTTETKVFEVVSVDGNRVVVKGENGAAQEITVPDDFRLTVDGKPVSVQELKPGMKGVARITTTITSTPVTVTEVKKGTVVKVVGNSIIVRTEEGNKMFTAEDAAKRGVKINRPDGTPINFSNLREGYELTATIVTQKPPQVMTQREVDAALSSVPAPAPAPQVARAEPAPAAPAAPSAPTPARRLPKTASALPLFALVGSAALAIAGILMVRRRRE